MIHNNLERLREGGKDGETFQDNGLAWSAIEVIEFLL